MGSLPESTGPVGQMLSTGWREVPLRGRWRVDHRHMWRPPSKTVDAVSTASARPLVITADPDLLDEVLRLAAAAGVEVEVAAHAQAAQRSWRRASAVVIGDDLVDQVISAELSRRPNVVLACLAPSGDEPESVLWRKAVAVGVEHVVSLPEGEAWLVSRLGESLDSLHREARVIAFIGGRGGVGVSTLAAAVALRAANRGVQVALIDCDSFGGGLDLVLGMEDVGGVRWPDLSQTAGRVSSRSLADALPRSGCLSLLSWDRGVAVDLTTAAVASVLDSAARGFELVVIDLPRASDETTSEALRRAHEVFLVVPREIRALAASQRVLALLTSHAATVSVITRGPSPCALDPESVARSLGVTVIADVGSESRIAAAVERGELVVDRGALMRVADTVLATVGQGQAAA